MSTKTLSEKQLLQEAEFRRPYHWLSKRTTRVRYERFSDLIAERILAHLPEGGTILDAGCGDGKGTADLHERLGGHGFTVRGADYSERAILHAKAMTYGSGMEFDIVDLVERPTERFDSARCDGLVLREVIEHLTDDEVDAALRGVRAVLRDGGLVVVSVPCDNLALSAKHYRHYSQSLLEETLESRGFRVLETIGFGYSALYWERLLKLNHYPKIWRVLNPLWRQVEPRNACELLALGQTRPVMNGP